MRFLPSCLHRARAASRLATFAAILCALAATGCQGVLDLDARENAPVPKALLAKMKARNMSTSAPIMIRIFKDEDVLEVWKQKRTGTYALLDSFEICKWSGKFGPKFKEGDRQSPEGFYTVNKWQMNPRSEYHLSFNIGFPNAYDRAHGRTGTHLMVHGACSSAGCYSMTDEHVQVIYALAREALAGGQERFQVQAYPFRMTPQNMAKHRGSKHYPFWKMLKRGYDHFELTKVPPKVNVCEKRYVFNTQSKGTYRPSAQCPTMTMPRHLATRFVDLQKDDAKTFAKKLPGDERSALAPVTFASVMGPIKVAGAPTAKKPEAAIEEAAPAAGATVPPASGESPQNVAAASDQAEALDPVLTASTAAPAKKQPRPQSSDR